MTPKEIAVINAYRAEGLGCKRISTLTGVPVNTVKTYIRRHPEIKQACLCCGVQICQPAHTRTKKFCSDACRHKWWGKNQGALNRTLSVKTCLHCGKEYSTHKKGQKFCSRDCYSASKQKEEPHDA